MIDERNRKRLGFYKLMLLGTILLGGKTVNRLFLRFQIQCPLFPNFGFSFILFDTSTFSWLALQDKGRMWKILVVQLTGGILGERLPLVWAVLLFVFVVSLYEDRLLFALGTPPQRSCFLKEAISWASCRARLVRGAVAEVGHRCYFPKYRGNKPQSPILGLPV